MSMNSNATGIQLLSAVRANSSTLNLLPLQRIDESITQVIFTAKHGVLYTLDQSQKEIKWNREEVEGPFFIVARRIPSYYQLIILNRRSIDNYVEDVDVNMTFEVQENYLFFQSASGAVMGIWFYDQPETEQAADALNKLVSALSQPNFRPPTIAPTSITPSPIPQGVKSFPIRPAQVSLSNGNNKSIPPTSSPHKHKPNPPPIFTGKRLNPHAPPPSIDYAPALDSNHPAALTQRLAQFMQTFEQKDEGIQQSHAQAIQAQIRANTNDKSKSTTKESSIITDNSFPSTSSSGYSLPLDTLFQNAHLLQSSLPPMPTNATTPTATISVSNVNPLPIKNYHSDTISHSTNTGSSKPLSVADLERHFVTSMPSNDMNTFLSNQGLPPSSTSTNAAFTFSPTKNESSLPPVLSKLFLSDPPSLNPQELSQQFSSDQPGQATLTMPTLAQKQHNSSPAQPSTTPEFNSDVNTNDDTDADADDVVSLMSPAAFINKSKSSMNPPPTNFPSSLPPDQYSSFPTHPGNPHSSVVNISLSIPSGLSLQQFHQYLTKMILQRNQILDLYNTYNQN